jgi:hypothetical protein
MQVSTGRSALNPYIALVIGLLALALYVATSGKTLPKDLGDAEKAAAAAATTAASSVRSEFGAPGVPGSAVSATSVTQPSAAVRSPLFASAPTPPTSVGPTVPLASAASSAPASTVAGSVPSQVGGNFGEPSSPSHGLNTGAPSMLDDVSGDVSAAVTTVATTATSLAADADVGTSVLWTLLSILVGLVVFFGLLAVLSHLGGVDISAAIRRGVGSTPGLYDVTLSQPEAPVAPSMAPQPAEPTSQVFQVGNGNLTYVEAKAACQAQGAKLATYSQLEDAYNQGAEWCSYGWSDGQLALFPTQKETYDRLQQGCTGDQNSCGRPGINGGYIANPNVRFGANCYGEKPKPTKAEKRALKDGADGMVGPLASEAARLAQLFRQADKHFKVQPFAPGEWSATATSGSSSSSDQSMPADVQATL